MTNFPDSHRDLLDAQVATLATIGGNGFPQLTEVWLRHDDGEHDNPGESRVILTIEPANVYAVDMSGG
jgi:hypothetical protein